MNNQRGVALIITISTVLLIATLISGILLTIKHQIRETISQKEFFLYEVCSKNLLENLKLQIQNKKIVSKDELLKFEHTSNNITVYLGTILDQSLLLDINTVSDGDLFEFFKRNGFTESNSKTYSDVILDWRDQDGIKRQFGAEILEYEKQGARRPANRNFYSKFELNKVAEVRNITDNKLLSALTVHGRNTRYITPDEINTNENTSLTGRTFEATIIKKDKIETSLHKLTFIITGEEKHPLRVISMLPTSEISTE